MTDDDMSTTPRPLRSAPERMPTAQEAIDRVRGMLRPTRFRLADWRISGPTRLDDSATVAEYTTSFDTHDLVLRRVRMDGGGDHAREYRFKISVVRGGDIVNDVHTDSVTHELAEVFATLERQTQLASPTRSNDEFIDTVLAWLEPRIDNDEIAWTVDGPYEPGVAGVTELSTTVGTTELTLMYGAVRGATTGSSDTVAAMRVTREDTVIALVATRDVSTQLWRVTTSALEQHQARIAALQAQAARDFDGL